MVFLSFLTAERDREIIEELSAALRDEKSRAEHIQLALTNERRQTEALKHTKERGDQLRNINKGKGLAILGNMFTETLFPVMFPGWLN